MNNSVSLDAEPRPELRTALLPAVPSIVDAAITEIRRHGPYEGYSMRALEKNIRIGLTDACERWFGNTLRAADTELHFALGRAQARTGRSLDELMRFYRIAGQTAWRRVTEVGATKGIAPADLYRLAETGFGYVDELSAQAAAGYAEEQSHRSSASHLRRSELVRLLLREPQPGGEVLEEAAQAIGIELTPTLAFFVGAADRYESFARQGRDHFVLGPREDAFVGAIFDPGAPARRRGLEAAARRARTQLALGPAVPVTEARTSLEQAQALFLLLRRGLVGGDQLVEADNHDVPLLLSAEPAIAQAMSRRRLAPLDAVRGETTRENLALTLGAWLRHQGQRKAIAHSLGIHPQTVRYRVGRLRELFGAALDDPDGRFELDLALRLRPYSASEDPADPDPGSEPR